MPTIVAMCPYCRAGGVRAAAHLVGASATCPRCHSSFTVMPSEVRPDWASDPANVATPAMETVPNAVLADVTEPSPIVPGAAGAKSNPTPPPEPPEPPAKKKRKRKEDNLPVARVIAPPPRNPVAEEPEEEVLPVGAEPEPRPAPVAAAVPGPVPAAPPRPQPAQLNEPDDYEEPLDYGLAFALVALILVGPAVLASQLPYGRFVAAGLGVVGLLGGIAALGTEGRARLMAVGAIALHSFVLLIVLFVPSVLDLDPWLGHPDETGPVGPFVVSHATGQRSPLTSSTWIDAGNSSWEYQDLRVTVVSAHSGPLQLTGPKDAKRQTKEQYFQLHVRVANTGVERKIDLSGWAAGQGTEGVRVTDAGGKTLVPAKLDGPWLPDPGKPMRQLFPGHPSDVKFVFVAPPAATGSMKVELSGATFGLPEQIVKFQTGSVPFARPTP